MLHIEEKIKQQVKRLKTVKTWQKRIEKLDISETAFCLKHDITHTRFNAIKNGNNNYLPSEKYINAVEKALEQEGV